MSKYMFLLTLIVLLAACGYASEANTQATVVQTQTTTPTLTLTTTNTAFPITTHTLTSEAIDLSQIILTSVDFHSSPLSVGSDRLNIVTDASLWEITFARSWHVWREGSYTTNLHLLILLAYFGNSVDAEIRANSFMEELFQDGYHHLDIPDFASTTEDVWVALKPDETRVVAITWYKNFEIYIGILDFEDSPIDYMDAADLLSHATRLQIEKIQDAGY